MTKIQKNNFLMHTNFLTMTIRTLFYCCKNVFILINIWIIGKNSVEHYYLKKKDFYSPLNMEDITDADNAHAKNICKDFEIKNLGEYHDLYVQNDTFLLEYLDFICLKIDELDPAKVLLSPGLAWQATLKKTKLTLDLLIDIDMLLMVDKGMRGGIYYSIS